MAEIPVYYPIDETHNAEIFARRCVEQVRYVTGRGFRIYDGVAWRTDAEDIAVTQKLIDHLGEMHAMAETLADPKSRMQATNAVSKFRNSAQLRGTVSILRSVHGISMPGTDLNRDPMLFNVQNGTLNLRTAKLLPHSQEDMITKCAPLSFREDAECPLWEAFVARVTSTKEGEPRPDLALLIQRIVGYLLTGRCSEQVAFFFYGTGANGKGTFMSTLRALLSDYATTTNSETFIRTRGDQHPTAVADLSEAHLVWCDELAEDAVLNEDLLKTMTGEGPRKARYMRKDFFEFIPRFKIVFTTNALPTVMGDNRAIWRRIIPIPFDLVIPHAERDHEIYAKLHSELPGILNWALRGCLEWQRQGLNANSVECVRTLREDYKEEEDTILDAINEICVFGKHEAIHQNILYQAYVRHCRRLGMHPFSKQHFGRRLQQKNFMTLKRGGHRYWLGLTIRGMEGQTNLETTIYPAEVISADSVQVPENEEDSESGEK